ncbi:MAG: transglycosylase domain-containing protein [Hyphomicrobium sp.]
MRFLEAILALWRSRAGGDGASMRAPAAISDATPHSPLPPPFDALHIADEPPLRGVDAPKWGRIRQLIAQTIRRLSWKWRVLIGLPLAGLAVGVPVFAFLMVYYTVSFPHPLVMRAKERAPVIRILARDGSVLAERGAAHDYMPIDLLPKHVVGAVVAIEDRRFFDHYGVDPWGFARAVMANLRAGRLAQGGSTLTQQLAKNLFLSPERTFSRKLEELALSFWLELRLSKAEILELYLNRVYFGAGAYGIEAASQRYFDKSARALSVSEAALIAGLLKAPSKYSPFTSPDLARARARVVVEKMAETGVITAQEARMALAERVAFANPQAASAPDGLEYAIDFVLERLPPLIGGGHGEVIVETTLDSGLQKKAGEVVERALARQGGRLGASQAALVLLDSEGAIRAMIGGRNYAESQFNRAVKARRQPGSAFKPVVYLAALERGMLPETSVYDLPLNIDGWSPRNDNGAYAGKTTLRQALAQSINTVAVQLNQTVGTTRTIGVARRLGITSDLREDPSIALGTSEVSLLELTGAYAVFSNGGTSVEPYAIRRVRLSSGRVVFARAGMNIRQVADPALVGELNSMLNSAMMSGTGRRAAIPWHPAGGKTGTTQDFRDAWFVGFTAHLTAGVWVGNDNGAPMKHAVGGGLPAEIWHELMMTAHAGKAPLALPGTVSATRPPAALVSSTDAMEAPSDAATPPQPQQTAPPAPVPAKRQHKPLDRQAADFVTNPNQSRHPEEGIADDFITRALAGTEENSGEVVADATKTPLPAPDRPRGMMSLGGWW